MQKISTTKLFKSVTKIIVSTIFLASCRTIPLPQQVTKFDTYQIVQRARCEVRDAIRKQAAQYVEITLGRPEFYDGIIDGSITLDILRDKFPNPESLKVLNRYANSAVAYEFTFNMTVIDKLGGSIDFLRMFSQGPFSFGLSASRARTNSNNRNFQISDTFIKLSTTLDNRVCGDVSGTGRNSYPITGRLGLDDIVNVFLGLNQYGNLTGEDNLPTISDTISFSTTVATGTEPDKKFENNSSGLNVAGVNLEITGSRTDVHNLVIAFTLPPSALSFANPAAAAEKRAFAELARQRERILEENGTIIRARIIQEISQ